MSTLKDNVRKLLIAAALAASTSAFGACSPDWHFSPSCTPDTPDYRSVDEPSPLMLLALVGGGAAIVRRFRKK